MIRVYCKEPVVVTVTGNWLIGGHGQGLYLAIETHEVRSFNIYCEWFGRAPRPGDVYRVVKISRMSPLASRDDERIWTLEAFGLETAFVTDAYEKSDEFKDAVFAAYRKLEQQFRAVREPREEDV